MDPLLDNWPKFEPSPKLLELMPAEWGADHRAWCTEFFGTENKAMVVNRALLVGPKGMQALRAGSKVEKLND
ncbi:hypothetical protein [Cupriavidus sp. Marseille-Q8015]